MTSAGSAASKDLRTYLLGAWVLESYAELAEDESVANWPLGNDARGLLIYSSDGFMSAFLAPATRRPFASGDWFSPAPDELAEAARVIAYAGRYHVDQIAGTVTHAVELSFFPNWSGLDQVRRVARPSGRLVLKPEKPIQSDGRMTWPQLVWVRPPAG